MRRTIKQSASTGDNSTILQAARDINFNVPTELINPIIEEEINKLCKLRFFYEFDKNNSSLKLGRRLTEGNLSVGSDETRAKGLAWCARVLSASEELQLATEFLEVAESLADNEEINIARAFIIAKNGDVASALRSLAGTKSQLSRSAGLFIVALFNGSEYALQWIDDAGFAVNDLDPDGKSSLLIHQLQLGKWEEVPFTLSHLAEGDFDQTPCLYHLAAIATLAPTIPEEFRALALAQVPFEVRNFPLADDAGAVNARKNARNLFLKAVNIEVELECPQAARLDDSYALWLELRDQELYEHGKKRLEDKLRDDDTDAALGVVHYAIQFGFKLDLEQVERRIKNSIALNGGMTFDSAIARFALAFTKKSPEEVANYLAHHYDQLALHIDSHTVRFSQIEMLSRAGIIAQANNLLEQLVEEGIPVEHERSLRRTILAAQGSDPVVPSRKQYEDTGAVADLMNLVTALEDRHYWSDLCVFGRLLFEKTRSLHDAERLVNALKNNHDFESIVEFLRKNSDQLSQSDSLLMAYAWSLYHEGQLLESREQLEKLDDKNTPNYRALRVNLSIAIGDWSSLFSYVADELRHRKERTAHELINTARLALHLRSPHTKDFVIEATTKAPSNSSVLAAAYYIATSAGWENDARVCQWLEQAVTLSKGVSPFQKMSLRELFDQKPDWDRRESQTLERLAQAQLPMFLAARSLNRNLVDLTAFPALTNIQETDPRRRAPIPAFSAKQTQKDFNCSYSAVSFDPTALLTLGFLGIIDKVLDQFENIYIPHSTLPWLLEEYQKATFHQPSRVQNARKVRDLLATGMLKDFNPSTAASSNLSAQVGDELAALIAEAEAIQVNGEAQRLVVRPAPVHRVSSLMEEEADLSDHEHVLSSCLAVIEKMKQKGKITVKEERQARSYLEVQEKPWPNQPEIPDDAVLYLDDLAVSYFSHLGLLAKFEPAGLTAVVSQREVTDVNALINYEQISDGVQNLIEEVRASLHLRIERGQVKVGGRLDHDEQEESNLSGHPSMGIMVLASRCGAVITDDRFLNQHANIDSGGALVPVFSTLDVINGLSETGVFSDEERLEYRTQLRQAGYFFVPIDMPELLHCLLESPVIDGQLTETAELKAIRESVLRVRMSTWLQLPQEAAWLDGTLKTFTGAFHHLWNDDALIDEAIVRSDWLIKQLDIRGWAHSLAPESADNVIQIDRGLYLLLLLRPPIGTESSVVDRYWELIEERILIPIREQFPELFSWLINWHQDYIEKMAETMLLGDEES